MPHLDLKTLSLSVEKIVSFYHIQFQNTANLKGQINKFSAQREMMTKVIP